jgi:phospholipid transport system substrate-binding protein
MKFFSLLFVGIALFLPLAASAQEIAPDLLVKGVTNEVLDIVRNDKDIQSGSHKKAIALVETRCCHISISCV